MSKIRTSKVIKKFGDWEVTTYGVECTNNYYPIEKKMLHKDWSYQVWTHIGISLHGLDDALDFARKHFEIEQTEFIEKK